MIIRPYQSEDKDQLIRIMHLNTPAYFDPSEVFDYADYLDADSDHYYVAEQGGLIIGGAGVNYFLEEGLARLSWDLVDPQHQKEGIGTQLTRFRISAIRQNAAIRLIVVRTTQLVFPFYERFGFRLESVEKDYWAEGFDLYYMYFKL